MPFAELEDVRLHYTLDGDGGNAAEQASVSRSANTVGKPVLMLSNSLGTSGEMWAPQVPAFAEHFRVLRYDTRGHGQSSVTPGPYSIPQLGTDVIRLLDYLGIERVHFCGLSMGGITGMWLGIHAAPRIDHLILSNTAAFIGPSDAWTTRADKVLAEGVSSIAPAVVAKWLTPAFTADHPEKARALIALLTATSDQGYAANCIAVRDADFRKDLSAIMAPTLVISGSGDVPTPPADGQYLASQIRGAEYVEFDAAHLANQEVGPVYAETVLRFLGIV